MRNLLYNRFDMEPMDSILNALADPTRRAILQRLALGEATVAQLCAPFGISQPAISRHLKVLEAAGLIETRIDGSARPRRLRQDGVDALWDWMSAFRAQLAANYDRLDAVLERQAQEGRPDENDPGDPR